MYDLFANVNGIKNETFLILGVDAELNLKPIFLPSLLLSNPLIAVCSVLYVKLFIGN